MKLYQIVATVTFEVWAKSEDAAHADLSGWQDEVNGDCSDIQMVAIKASKAEVLEDEDNA